MMQHLARGDQHARRSGGRGWEEILNLESAAEEAQLGRRGMRGRDGDDKRLQVEADGRSPDYLQTVCPAARAQMMEEERAQQSGSAQSPPPPPAPGNPRNPQHEHQQACFISPGSCAARRDGLCPRTWKRTLEWESEECVCVRVCGNSLSFSIHLQIKTYFIYSFIRENWSLCLHAGCLRAWCWPSGTESDGSTMTAPWLTAAFRPQSSMQTIPLSSVTQHLLETCFQPSVIRLWCHRLSLGLSIDGTKHLG